MEIANMNPNTGFTLQSKDCIKEFSWILLNYDNGGEKQCNGWYFRYVFSLYQVYFVFGSIGKRANTHGTR
jgi:hypothetical protein